MRLISEECWQDHRVIATNQFGDAIPITVIQALKLMEPIHGEKAAEDYVTACVKANMILSEFMKLRGWMK